MIFFMNDVKKLNTFFVICYQQYKNKKMQLNETQKL